MYLASNEKADVGRKKMLFNKKFLLKKKDEN